MHAAFARAAILTATSRATFHDVNFDTLEKSQLLNKRPIVNGRFKMQNQ